MPGNKHDRHPYTVWIPLERAQALDQKPSIVAGFLGDAPMRIPQGSSIRDIDVDLGTSQPVSDRLRERSVREEGVHLLDRPKPSHSTSPKFAVVGSEKQLGANNSRRESKVGSQVSRPGSQPICW